MQSYIVNGGEKVEGEIQILPGLKTLLYQY